MSWLDHFRCPLTYREMLGLAWQLTWPAITADIIWSVVTKGIFEAENQAVEAAFAIPFLLFLGPYLVRRMFRRKYEGFQLKAFRRGQPADLSHAEGFKAFWLLSWRVLVPMLAFLLVVSFFLRFVKVDLASLVPSSKEAPIFNAIGLSLVENTTGFFLLPLIMPGMFAKRYQGFRLVAERTPATTAPAKPKPRR